MSNNEPKMRLRFFGLSDYGTFFQTEQAFKVISEFDAARTRYTINDVVELNHAVLYAEHDLFPKTATDIERAKCKAEIPKIRRAIGKFFGEIKDTNFAKIITDVDFQYHTDVLEHLARNKIFDRCKGSTVLPALRTAKIHCGELLSCQALVRAYDEDVRNIILSAPQNAEQLIAKYLHSDKQRPIFLPQSFTPADSGALLDAYLDEDEPNLNFTKLIATARVNKGTGIDAKLKLKTRRKSDALTAKFFEANEGIETGCEIAISDDQEEDVVESMDGMVGRYSYSRRWLTESLDYPTILNNFVYLFQFANLHMILELPSYHADLGVFERFMVTSGNESYKTGAAFDFKNQASFLQTLMYDRFLRTEGVELEAVISWFFADYLRDEFGAEDFKFRSSSLTATYLEKSRHLFSEMESVLKQYSLYVENGELDLELLAMTSEQLSYQDVPSLLEGKYVYTTDQPDIQRIQHLLFSDQSGLCYISEELTANNFARLIIANEVAYGSFHEYQKRDIDFLIEKRILGNTGERIKFASMAQFQVLIELWDHEAANYYHSSQASRGSIDDMVHEGWLERRESLLSTAEASYFNYFLNDKEFSDGPALRNRYLHGSQADGDDDRVHFRTYIIALRLIIALVIKVNDDFCQDDKRKNDS